MNPAELVSLGASGLTVTRLGLGTAPLAGLYAPVAEADAVAVVHRALDAGLRFFDTAPLYGHGEAERRLGRALSGPAGADGAGAVVATKVGRLLVPTTEDAGDDVFPVATGLRPVFDFSYRGVMRSVEESLARLGLDHVDVLHIHDPDDHFAEAVSGAVPALVELRAKGTVAAIGAGMNQAPMLAALAEHAAFDCFLLAGRYTLLDQSGADMLLPLCARRGIAVIAGGVFNSGILADPRADPHYDYAPAGTALVERALAIQQVCDRHDVPLRAAAIQFPYRHPAIVSVLAGARSAQELDDSIAMARWPIPEVLWADLDHAGLVPFGPGGRQ